MGTIINIRPSLCQLCEMSQQESQIAEECSSSNQIDKQAPNEEHEVEQQKIVEESAEKQQEQKTEAAEEDKEEDQVNGEAQEVVVEPTNNVKSNDSEPEVLGQDKAECDAQEEKQQIEA